MLQGKTGLLDMVIQTINATYRPQADPSVSEECFVFLSLGHLRAMTLSNPTHFPISLIAQVSLQWNEVPLNMYVTLNLLKDTEAGSASLLS